MSLHETEFQLPEQKSYKRYDADVAPGGTLISDLDIQLRIYQLLYAVGFESIDHLQSYLIRNDKVAESKTSKAINAVLLKKPKSRNTWTLRYSFAKKNLHKLRELQQNIG